MTKAVYFIKPGVWGTSGIAQMTAGNTYTLNAVVRDPYTSGLFWKCTQAGGVGSSPAPVESSQNPENEIYVAGSYWLPCSGTGGAVANTWTIACEDLSYPLKRGSTLIYARWYYGRMYDAVTFDASIVYIDSAAQLSIVPLRDNGGCSQAYTSTYEYGPLGDGGSYYTVPPGYMPATAKFISADSSIPSGTTATYKKGATLVVPPNTDSRYLAGRNYFKGITFLANSAGLTVSHFIPGLGSRAIQFTCVNTWDDCIFTLGTDAGYPTRASYLHLADREGGSVSYDAGMPSLSMGDQSVRGTDVYHHMRQCTINLDNALSYIQIAGRTRIASTTVTTTRTTFNPDGLLRIGTSVLGSVDVDIDMVGVIFGKSIPKLLSDACYGRATLTMDGCSFVDGDIDALAWTLPPTLLGQIMVNMVGCGTAGAIDPYDHRYYTPRVKGKKVNGVYRVGSLPDPMARNYSYYIETRSTGLDGLGSFDSLPHLSRSVAAGTYEIRLLVACPPDQLLYDDDLFAYFIAPDTSANSSLPWSTSGDSYAGTDGYTNSASRRRVSPLFPRTLYPVVSQSWVGVPVGWVTQAISVFLNAPYEGRVYCTPMVGKPGATFILCPTLDLLQVM